MNENEQDVVRYMILERFGDASVAIDPASGEPRSSRELPADAAPACLPIGRALDVAAALSHESASFGWVVCIARPAGDPQVARVSQSG